MLNMKENELDQLASFLGHDIRIHREFYRLPESTLQLAKVSKILIAMEKGRLPELQGEGLDDIIINPQDEVDMSSGVSSDEEGFSGLHQTQNKMNQGSSSMPHSKDDNLIDSSSDEMEYADLRAMHSERTQGVGRKRSQKNLEKSPDSTLQTTMSHTKLSADTAEVKAIERHLMDHIRGCKVPGKRQCMSCLLSEPVALKSRNWSSIKYYVNNRIVALKRKMCQ
ncbi:uncharacterized protein LOC130402339 [Gadus chalcogrammus]|uniref:uncharacterized protein LOC130402339 n=1 Tax=Gadus chalcogrammus TaxID=1042646 RepID=UPI0024C49512|nr:uncharacterized protein LOC130402339 [Gadus chalcogrammus]